MPIHCLATSIAILPWWLVYLGLGLFAFAGALLFQSVGGYLILRRLRVEQPQHWVERARLAFPYATFSTIHLTMVGTGWLVAGVPLWRNLWAPLPLAAAAVLGILVRSRPTWQHLRGQSPGNHRSEPGAWIPLPVLNAIFILLPILVVVSIAGKSASQAWLAIAALILGMIGYRAWLSIPVARALGVLRPAPESLQNSIDKVARECAIGPPKAYVVGSETANAFALPTCYSIAFTSDALRILTSAECKTIIRHEIAHLTESLPLRWLRLCNVIVYVPLMSIPPLTGSFGLSGLWIGLLGYLILSRLWGHFSRLMESRADDQAKRHSGGQAESADPAGSASEQNLIYAGALEKLYRHNLVPAVLPGRGLSHPNLYDRLTAAGAKPSFPRPAPPPRGPLALASALALAGLVAALKIVVYLESS